MAHPSSYQQITQISSQIVFIAHLLEQVKI